jgi:hypothetical protein
MELLALCTVLSMLPTGLICDLHWHRQSSTINRREKCCRQQGNQPQSTCNVCSTSCVALSAWSLLSDSGIRDSRRKRMFERCRQATQQSTCKKETRRACGAGLSVSEELAMLGSHSQLAETQCMIQLYLQQQSSATASSAACSSCLFWRIGPVKQTLHCAACTWLNLSVAQTQCMQQ